MKKRIISAFIALMLLLCCLPLSASSATASPQTVPETSKSEDKGEESSAESEITSEDQETISALSEAYSQLQAEVDRLQSEKDAVTSEKKDTYSYLKKLQSQIAATEKQIGMLDDEISDLSEQLENLNVRISDLEAGISEELEVFKARLRAIYMAGRTSEIELLLASDSFVDLLTRAEILKRISEYDNKVIVGLQKDKDELDTIAAEVSDNKARTEEAKTESDAKSKQLAGQYDESENVYKSLQANEKEYAAYIKQYQNEMEEAQKEIDEILAKYVSADNYAGGELAWPLPTFTRITSPYGQRSSGFHTGTDIAGVNAAGDLSYGYPIVAANSGTVILVGDRGNTSYGKYLIIDHGENCRTLYAHCSKILVKEGDVVVRGQTVAKVGSTGNSTGAHLHFELWMYGTRVNPMEHLVVPKYS